jgi:hypothetical protein
MLNGIVWIAIGVGLTGQSFAAEPFSNEPLSYEAILEDFRLAGPASYEDIDRFGNGCYAVARDDFPHSYYARLPKHERKFSRYDFKKPVPGGAVTRATLKLRSSGFREHWSANEKESETLIGRAAIVIGSNSHFSYPGFDSPRFDNYFLSSISKSNGELSIRSWQVNTWPAHISQKYSEFNRLARIRKWGSRLLFTQVFLAPGMNDERPEWVGVCNQE